MKASEPFMMGSILRKELVRELMVTSRLLLRAE